MVKRSVPVTRGSLSHLMVPQSKIWVSTLAGVTKRRPANLAIAAPLLMILLEIHLLKTHHLIGDCPFGRQAFDARGAKKSCDAFSPTENVFHIFRLCNWAPVTKNQNLRAQGTGRFADGLNAGNRLVQSDSCLGADRALCGQSHVRDQKVGTGFGHGTRLVRVENI